MSFKALYRVDYEYDIKRLKYLTYKLASVRVRACVHACAVEIKPGMLRAAYFDDVRVWTRIWFALRNGDFLWQKGVI